MSLSNSGDALRDATSLAQPGVAFLEFATEETSIAIGLGSDPQPSDVVDNRYTTNATSCPRNAESVNSVSFQVQAVHDPNFRSWTLRLTHLQR